MIRRTACALATLLLATFVAADDRVLLPIVVQNPVPGAYGSLWTTHLTLFNRGSAPLQVTGGLVPCHFDPCITPGLPARTTTPVVPRTAPDVPARFLFVEAGRGGDLDVQLRVQDLSRQAETWGTEIPVVREADASLVPLNLLDLPTAGDFRTLVRIYDFDPAAGRAVMVRLFRPGSGAGEDQLLAEVPLALRVPANTIEYPGYAEIGLWSLGVAAQRVRVEVAPLTPNVRFWAFASITHNATQHVTLVTP